MSVVFTLEVPREQSLKIEPYSELMFMICIPISSVHVPS